MKSLSKYQVTLSRVLMRRDVQQSYRYLLKRRLNGSNSANGKKRSMRQAVLNVLLRKWWALTYKGLVGSTQFAPKYACVSIFSFGSVSQILEQFISLYLSLASRQMKQVTNPPTKRVDRVLVKTLENNRVCIPRINLFIFPKTVDSILSVVKYNSIIPSLILYSITLFQQHSCYYDLYQKVFQQYQLFLMPNYELTYPLASSQFYTLYKANLNSFPAIIMRINEANSYLINMNMQVKRSVFLSRISQIYRNSQYLDLIIENLSGFNLSKIESNEISIFAIEIFMGYSNLQEWDFLTENIFTSDNKQQKVQILDFAMNKKKFEELRSNFYSLKFIKDNNASSKVLLPYYYAEWDPSIFFSSEASKTYSLGIVLFAFISSKDYLKQIKNLVQIQILQNFPLAQILKSIVDFILHQMQKHFISSEWQQVIIKLITNRLQWNAFLNQSILQQMQIKSSKKRMISLSSLHSRSESTESSQKVNNFVKNESQISRNTLIKSKLSKSIQNFSKKNEFNSHFQTSSNSPSHAPINKHFFQTSQKMRKRLNFKTNFEARSEQQQSKLIQKVETYLNDKKQKIDMKVINQQQYNNNEVNYSTSLLNSLSQNSDPIEFPRKLLKEQGTQVQIQKKDIQIQTEIPNFPKKIQGIPKETQTYEKYEIVTQKISIQEKPQEKKNQEKPQEYKILEKPQENKIQEKPQKYQTQQKEIEIIVPKVNKQEPKELEIVFEKSPRNKSDSSQLRLIIDQDDQFDNMEDQFKREISIQNQQQININHDLIYQQYIENIEDYSLIGDTVVKLLQRVNGLKNFWIVPLYLSFKCMFQMRVKILNFLLDQQNILEYPFFDQFKQSDRYKSLIDKISNENTLIADELSQIEKIARNKAKELEPEKRQKILWFINGDLEQDYQRTNFIYLWCQIRPLVKEKTVEDLKLRFMLEQSILMFEHPLFDESYDRRFVQKILASKNIQTVLSGLKYNQAQLKPILEKYQRAGIRV